MNKRVYLPVGILTFAFTAIAVFQNCTKQSISREVASSLSSSEDATLTKMAKARKGPRPNLVVVMTDDLDETTLRDAESRGWLPNISSLRAEGGLSFDNSFVTLSLCCPSRSAFLTGMYPHNTGVLSNVMPMGSVEVFDDSVTLATWLQSSGYYTAKIGKYINRYGRGGPTGEGPLKDTYVPPGWSNWQATIDPTTYSMYNYIINDNGNLVQYGGSADEPGGSDDNYQTDILAKRSVEVIQNTPDEQPLFLMVTPLAAHLEAAEEDEEAKETVRPAPRHMWVLEEDLDIPRGPAYNEEDVSDKARVIQRIDPFTEADDAYLVAQYRGRLGSLLAVDDLVGDLIKKLQEKGRLENTVFLFTSDNGWLYGEHRVTHKRFPYEESIRVPLIIKDFRQKNESGRNIEQFALNIDIAPTLLDLAHMRLPDSIDGRSLRPLMNSKKPVKRWRRRFFVRGPANSKVHFLGVRTASTDLSTPNSIYVQYQERCNERCEEFYNLDEDPYQLESTHREARRKESPPFLKMTRWVDMLKDCKGQYCRRVEDCRQPNRCRE